MNHADLALTIGIAPEVVKAPVTLPNATFSSILFVRVLIIGGHAAFYRRKGIFYKHVSRRETAQSCNAIRRLRRVPLIGTWRNDARFRSHEDHVGRSQQFCRPDFSAALRTCVSHGLAGYGQRGGC